MKKLWPVVAVAAISSSLVWACNGEPADSDGEGGQGGEGGAGTGGSGTGGTLSCDPEDGSESWGGAGGIGGAGGAGSISIFGDWTDQYGSSYSVDESLIDSGYAIYDVVGYSEGGQYIVARNPADATYYPCEYSRFDWTQDGADLYWCRMVLDAGSVEEALERPSADRDDLEAGCNGFPWSQLTAQ